MKAVVKNKKHLLSQKHRNERMDFAIRHKDWTLEDWKRVVWSEGRKWAWKRAGEGLSDRLVEGTVVRYQISNGSLTKSIPLHPFSATPLFSPSNSPLFYFHPISTLLCSSLFPPCFTLHPCLPVSLISIPILP